MTSKTGTAQYRLSKKQLQGVATSNRRVNIFGGSVRAGKTFSSLIRWLTVLADPPKGGEFIISGKNGDSIYRNVIAPFANEPALAWAAPYITYRQGANTATILGRRVNIIGANDTRAADRIRGMTVAAAYIDEVTVIPENFFTMLLSRMSPEGAILIGTTNPDSPNHWLKKNYLDRLDELPSWSYLHFNMDDNESLSEEYKNNIKAEYTGLWYDRFILGKWTAAEGAIYPMFDRDKHVVPFLDLPPARMALSIGLDYGTTNPSSALTLYLGEDNRLYLTDEWRIDQGNRLSAMTDTELSNSFTTWLAEPHHPTSRHQFSQVFVDPAAASFKIQLHRDGVRHVKNANNDVGYGIKLVASLIAADRLRVSDKCTGLLEEISGYRWDPKATERGQDIPVKEDDHSVDAARYAVTSSESWWRRYIPSI